MSKIISPLQAAFFPGRVILDNTIIVHEILHMMKKRLGKGGLMAIKVDMKRAYDKIEWPFLFDVMAYFGFCASWIN